MDATCSCVTWGPLQTKRRYIREELTLHVAWRFLMTRSHYNECSTTCIQLYHAHMHASYDHQANPFIMDKIMNNTVVDQTW
jgi:hypothetical protein